MGKKFVIMEVEKQHVAGDGTTKYYPKDQKFGECLWLHPDRIIDSSRLRYGVPKREDQFFNGEMGWLTSHGDFDTMMLLILDPEPKPDKKLWECPDCDYTADASHGPGKRCGKKWEPEQTEWDQWCKTMAQSILIGNVTVIEEIFKRMPPR